VAARAQLDGVGERGDEREAQARPAGIGAGAHPAALVRDHDLEPLHSGPDDHVDGAFSFFVCMADHVGAGLGDGEADVADDAVGHPERVADALEHAPHERDVLRMRGDHEVDVRRGPRRKDAETGARAQSRCPVTMALIGRPASPARVGGEVVASHLLQLLYPSGSGE